MRRLLRMSDVPRMAITVTQPSDVVARWGALEQRMSHWHALMRELEPWRHLDKPALIKTIWKGNPPEDERADRWTIVKPDIWSVTNTVTSFMTSRRPRITVTPKDASQLSQGDQANQVERIGGAIFDTIERDRSESLIGELAEYAIHRGAMVTKTLWLSPEERGEKRDDVPVDPFAPEGEAATEQITVQEGDFPAAPINVDPLECAWSQGRKGQPIEFIHHYYAPLDYLADIYPDLLQTERFRGRSTVMYMNTPVEVYDYWTEEQNAIVIEGHFYKQPTNHNYGRVPVVVTLANPRKPRYGDRGTRIVEGTPFCAAMLESVRHLSWLESLEAGHLEFGLSHLLVIENVDPNDSVHVQPNEDGDPEFNFVIDNRPGAQAVMTTSNKHGGEKLRQPLQEMVAPATQEYKAMRSRDSALVSFQEGILTGAYNIDLSGVSVAQQKQAAMARVAPYETAINQHLSRVFANIFDLFRTEWDYTNDAEITLVTLLGENEQTPQEMRVTRDVFDAIGNVTVKIALEVPTNREQEWTLLFQALAQGVMSRRQVIEELGRTQNPSGTLKEIIAETMMFQDPAMMAAIANDWMQRNGIKPAQPKPAPQAMPADPGMLAAQGGMPMDPAMAAMGGGTPQGMPMDPAMAAMGGGLPPELSQIPPEMLMALMAQMGGGMPQAGG